MGNELVPIAHVLMVVCSLGKDVGWSDPTVYTKIPMDAIIELWREQSSLCAVTELSLDAPLAHAHYAHADHAAYAAEVMLLTRSLVIRGSAESEYSPGNASNGFMDPTKEDCREFKMNRPCADEILDGYGGHILAEGVNASLHLSNVELYRMGQTNVRGRYPVHSPVHFHLMGEAAGRASARHVSVHHSDKFRVLTD